MLLAPIDRRQALLGPAGRQLRYLAFVGAAVGAAVGRLASLRLPGAAPVGRLRRGVRGDDRALLRRLRLCGRRAGGSDGRWPRCSAPRWWPGRCSTWPGWSRPRRPRLVASRSGRCGSIRSSSSPSRSHRRHRDRRAAPGRWRLARSRGAANRARRAAPLRGHAAGSPHRPAPAPPARAGASAHAPGVDLRRTGHHPVWRRDWRGIPALPRHPPRPDVRPDRGAAICLVVAYHDARIAVVAAALALYLVGLDAIEPFAQEVDQADCADAVPLERACSCSVTCRQPASSCSPPASSEGS